MFSYTLSDLEGFETLAVGQADDLKVDTGTLRIWLSRCSRDDGEPFDNKVTIERLVRGKWEVDSVFGLE